MLRRHSDLSEHTFRCCSVFKKGHTKRINAVNTIILMSVNETPDQLPNPWKAFHQNCTDFKHRQAISNSIIYRLRRMVHDLSGHTNSESGESIASSSTRTQPAGPGRSANVITNT
jgi:hypothetical protein